MAEAIAGRLMDNLQELALNEAKALVQVKNDIRRLRDRLVWLQAFLLEADPIRRVDGNLLTGVLVSQTRAVALDSEDAIDWYLVLSDTIASRRGWRRVIVVPKLLERFAQQFIVRHYLSVEVTMLNTRIEDILDSRDKYKLDGLRTGSKADAEKEKLDGLISWTLPTGHSTSSNVTRKKRFEDNWCKLPCRDMDKDKLRKHLLKNKKVFVIFMDGDSGVGKTALMRSAFNDSEILRYFHVRIWIDFPPCTSDTTIASKIERKLGNDSSSSHRLVVIDCNDVRFSGHMRLSEWLPDAREHDKIVLITSKKAPAAVVSQTFKHDGVERGNLRIELSRLEREDIWMLFYYKLLGVVIEKTKEGKGSSPELEKGNTSPVSEQEEGRGKGSIGHEVSEEERKGKGSTGHKVSDEDEGKGKGSIGHEVSEEERKGKGKGKGSIGHEVSEEEEGKEKGSIGHKVSKEEEGSHLVSKVEEITMGLPRAVVMLAHLLRTTERSSWGSLFQHICKSSKVEKRLQRILLLIFNALPNDLKSCFLYFAAFPQETKICTEELVRLWAAEGFLCPKDGKSMEFIGHGHLKELISRDLVQVVTKDDVGFVQSVSIANHVHNFLRMEARETSFLDVHFLYHVPEAATVRRLSIPDYQSESSSTLEHKYRKLRSLISRVPKEQGNLKHTAQAQPVGGEDDAPLPQRDLSSLNEDPKVGTASLFWTSLKTLINWGATKEDPTKPISRVLRGSRYLRVISLEGHNVDEKMLRCVSNKVHLRYLRVDSTNLTTTIPVSIGDLLRLQTLDVRGSKISRLPDEFWKIQTLRHVLGDGLPFPDPASATNLRNLQTLETMSLKGVDQWDGKIMLKMPNLETLAVEGLDGSNIYAALHQLIYLKRLRLCGDNIKLGSLGIDNHNLVLMELTHEKLSREDDAGFEDTSKLFNLSVLKLMRTHVEQAFINNIAQLPNLNHLSLQDISCADNKLEIPEQGFDRLEVLEVSVSASSDDDKPPLKIVVNSALGRLKTFKLISCKEVTIVVGGKNGNQDFNNQLKCRCSGGRYKYSIASS
ncbi:unnamed protein product [Urochloa decumbens]|uniref:Uncharacterized protein n=1 Tax=Urochloa decumbens TaxID=240449 RepID=A0ABC9AXE6_9POAL